MDHVVKAVVKLYPSEGTSPSAVSPLVKLRKSMSTCVGAQTGDYLAIGASLLVHTEKFPELNDADWLCDFASTVGKYTDANE